MNETPEEEACRMSKDKAVLFKSFRHKGLDPERERKIGTTEAYVVVVAINEEDKGLSRDSYAITIGADPDEHACLHPLEEYSEWKWNAYDEIPFGELPWPQVRTVIEYVRNDVLGDPDDPDSEPIYSADDLPPEMTELIVRNIDVAKLSEDVLKKMLESIDTGIEEPPLYDI